MPLKLYSRVRVMSVIIQATCSPIGRDRLLKCLGAAGTVISFDPRWTLPWLVKFDDGVCISFTKENLGVLEP